MRGFTETLRIEMLRDKLPVKVTVVHPGGVKTNIATAGLQHAAETRLRGHRPRAPPRAGLQREAAHAPRRAAAKIIIDGVEDGKPRVLVGNDAKVIDLIVRLVPRFYPAALVRFGGKVLGSAG